MSQGIVKMVDVEKWQEQTPSATPADLAGTELTSVRFAEVARRLSRAASVLGLTAPAFRSPPRQPGLQRSITRRPDGSATVAVAIRGRPAVAVVADMIDGVLAANQPPERGTARSGPPSARGAIGRSGHRSAGASGTGVRSGSSARSARSARSVGASGARSGGCHPIDLRDHLWSAVAPCLTAQPIRRAPGAGGRRRRSVGPAASPGGERAGRSGPAERRAA